MRRFCLFVVFCVGCSSGSGSAGSGAGGSVATGGSGGTGGSAGSAGAAPSPFQPELCNAGFCWEEPKPFGNRINAVSATATSVWAAGEGLLARRTDGAWTAAPAPSSRALKGIFAFSDDDVWAVGAEGAVVHFDGNTIEAVQSPTTQTLYGIWGAAPNDIWAVGAAGTIVHYDGAAWSPVDGGSDELHAVWGSGPNDVYAVGGTLNVGTVAHFDGTAWQSSMSGLDGQGFNAIAGSGPDTVYASGEYGFVYQLTSDGGQAFLGGNMDTEAPVTALALLGESDLWALSSDGLQHFDGSKFSTVAPQSGQALLYDSAASRFVIAGSGVFDATPDGAINSEIPAPRFGKVWLGNGGRGIATTSDDRVLTEDGASWNELQGLSLTGTLTSVGGLTDGTRVLLASDSYTGQALVFDGSALTPLPNPGVDYASYDTLIAGTSPSDIWLFSWTGPAHFDGSSWQLGTWPSNVAASGGFSANGALVRSPNDIWVVGSDTQGSAPGTVAHFDGANWTGESVGPMGTKLTSVAELGGKLYAAGGFTDYSQPQDYGFVYYPQAPVLYENAGSGWQQVAVPGADPQYFGSDGALVAASDTALYFVLQDPHAGMANLLEYDGTSFTPDPYPATACSAAFVTDGTLRLVAGNDADGILRARN